MQGKIISKDFNISTYENSKKLKKLTFTHDEKKEDNLKKNMINISKEKILGAKKKNYKFFLVSRMKKKDRFFLYPIYMKFLNRLMRKGYKNRYLTFFYKLLRAHKKRVFLYFNKNIEKKNIFKKVLPSFPLVFGIVFRFITLKIELKLKKIKRREIMTPAPMSPWRGWRTGLNILFINAKARLETIKRSRKVDFLYSILDEVWLTFQGNSATTKNIIEFTNNVLENSQNYRETELFPIRFDRQELVSIKPLLKLKKNTVVFKQETKKKKNIYSLISKFRKKRGIKLVRDQFRLYGTKFKKKQRKKYIKMFFSRKISNSSINDYHSNIVKKSHDSYGYNYRHFLKNKNLKNLKNSKNIFVLNNRILERSSQVIKSNNFVNNQKLNNSKKNLRFRSFSKRKIFKNIYKYNYKNINNSVFYKYKKFFVYTNICRRTNKRDRVLYEKERLKNV